MRDKKVLFITGASSDIGIALIKCVAYKYDKIIAHYNKNEEVLKVLQEELSEKLVLVQADFGDFDSIKGMIKKIRETNIYPDHVVFLAAPKLKVSQFRKIDREVFEKDMTISCYSTVEILREFLPQMSKKRYGKVVFMLTSYTIGNPEKFVSSYVCSKYALLGLMKSLSVEYAEKGIMINAISPDMINTKFLDNIPELIIKNSAQRSLVGRNLYVDDVIPALSFLLSDGADVICGQNIGIQAERV